MVHLVGRLGLINVAGLRPWRPGLQSIGSNYEQISRERRNK